MKSSILIETMSKIKNVPYGEDKNAKKFWKPFSEDEIIELQKIFLSEGFYHLETRNMCEGRDIMYTLIQPLKLHKRVACFSDLDVPLRYDVYDIYQDFCMKKMNDALYTLEQLFSEGQHFDFLWIEMTTTLPYNMIKQLLFSCLQSEITIMLLEQVGD